MLRHEAEARLIYPSRRHHKPPIPAFPPMKNYCIFKVTSHSAPIY
jgi:hypothetical protein